MKKIFFILILASLLLAFLAGCSGRTPSVTPTLNAQPSSSTATAVNPSPDNAAWDAVVAAAKEEGYLALYTTEQQSIVDQITAGFNKLYPEIEIAVVRGPSGDIAIRIDQEEAAGAPSADVITTKDPIHAQSLAESGRFLGISSPAMQTEAWKNTEFVKNGGAYIWAGYSPYGFTYNTNLLPDPPHTFEELIGRSDLEGSIGILTIDAGAAIAAWWQHVENQVGDPPKLLEGIARLKPAFYSSSAPLLQAVAAGELKFSAWGTPAGVAQLKADGAPIEYFSVDAAAGQPISVGVMAKATHPNTAQLFVDFLMSEAGQRLLTSDAKTAIPAIPGIDGPLGKSGDPSLFKLLPEQEGMDEAAYQVYISYWNSIVRP